MPAFKLLVTGSRDSMDLGTVCNKQMVDYGAHLCLAFILNKSRGATGCANLAEAAGIPTTRITLTW